MISGIESAISNPLAGKPPAQSAATNSSVEAQVAAKTSTAPIDANVKVQYRYERGPNGELIVASATVTIEEKPEPKGFANRVEATEDSVSLSSDINLDGLGLSDSEKAYLRELQLADAAVRTHEGLHFTAAAGLGSLPEYQTITGPDGNQYAVAGSVNVSTTQGADNERATRELETLGIAATAPADASAADLSAAKSFNQSRVAPPNEISQPDPKTEATSTINIIA